MRPSAISRTGRKIIAGACGGDHRRQDGAQPERPAHGLDADGHAPGDDGRQHGGEPATDQPLRSPQAGHQHRQQHHGRDRQRPAPRRPEQGGDRLVARVRAREGEARHAEHPQRERGDPQHAVGRERRDQHGEQQPGLGPEPEGRAAPHHPQQHRDAEGGHDEAEEQHTADGARAAPERRPRRRRADRRSPPAAPARAGWRHSLLQPRRGIGDREEQQRGDEGDHRHAVQGDPADHVQRHAGLPGQHGRHRVGLQVERARRADQPEGQAAAPTSSAW